MEIKDIIRSRRKEMGLTMKELADRVGVSEGTISRWESGHIDDMKRKAIAKLAKVTSIPLEILMGWETDADHFAKTAKAFNASFQERQHFKEFHLLNDTNKQKIVLLTQKLLEAQSAEENILIAAHRREGDEE